MVFIIIIAKVPGLIVRIIIDMKIINMKIIIDMMTIVANMMIIIADMTSLTIADNSK